ncbi:hypothetical protein H9Q72_010427 [Fusarium xylarioides]|uniref:Uncharacterized protein n=1 Tax=Fusarium xylarioides TaxID=221167 RepID=A0A9P7HKG5_9HYPO|nr:hypothetical protein H9Q72_010427 [Fusarium xylarioides]
MPPKGWRKRKAPEPPAEPPAKRGPGRPPGSKNKPKKTPDSEKISQQKATNRPSRPRAALPIAETSDEDSESESQDQEIPPVTDNQKWDDLLLKAKDRYEAKYMPVMQRYWRKAAAKPHTIGFEGLTKEAYEAKDEPGCPNPTYSKDWSHADEEKFLNEYWRGTVYEAAIKRQTRTNQDAQHLVTMFKISLHVFGVDPLTLWTLNEDEFDVTGSRYEAEFKVGDVTYPNPIWSRPFCDKLSQIMTHPIWTKRKERHVFMLFAVKWAIMCRTDDRRPLSEGDTKLLGFIGCPITPRPGEPLKRTLKRLLRRRYNAGETSTMEADLLRCIADNTKAHQTEPTPRYYSVTLDDLDAVIMGLDESELGVSCETQYGLYQNRRTTYTYPSRAEVAELYRNAFLNIERGRMIDHKSDSDSRPPSELPLRILRNSETRRRANTEQDPPSPVAGDPGHDNNGNQDVIISDEDNTRSQSLGTGLNEQTNRDRSSPDEEDIRPPGRSSRRKIGLSSNTSRPGSFEADEYLYIPPGNLLSDREESRHSDQRASDEEPEGLEEGGGDLLPSTTDDQHQTSKSTSPIAQATSPATEPITHTGEEETNGQELQADNKEEPRHSDSRVGDDELASLEQCDGEQHPASKSTSPIAQATSPGTEPLTHTRVEEASDHGLQGDESRPLTATPLGSFSTATSESGRGEETTIQRQRRIKVRTSGLGTSRMPPLPRLPSSLCKFDL